MLRDSFWKNVLKRASAIGTKRKITLVSYKNTEEYSCQGLDWQEINRISERIKTAKLALLLENDPTGYAESNSTQILEPKSEPITIVEFIKHSPDLKYLDRISGSKH